MPLNAGMTADRDEYTPHHNDGACSGSRTETGDVPGIKSAEVGADHAIRPVDAVEQEYRRRGGRLATYSTQNRIKQRAKYTVHTFFRRSPQKTALQRSYVLAAARRLARQSFGDFAGVKCYVMFVGYPRSGHSLVGALLNAHPNAVVAHEGHILRWLELAPDMDRETLFALLVRRDLWFERRMNRNWGGYNYSVPNLFEGRYERLDVVGDKEGAGSAHACERNPRAIDELREIVGVPIRLIHHMRNPFDNITSMSRMIGVDKAKSSYFDLVGAVSQIRDLVGSGDIIEMRHEEFVSSPREHLSRLCDFLGLTPHPEYIDNCARRIVPSARKTSRYARWTPQQIADVNARIRDVEFLNGYEFEGLT